MLPITVIAYLETAAKTARATVPDRDASLFEAGLLDSFGLVDFVALVEQECGIRVKDTELRPENFDTIAKVEAFIARAQAES